MNPARFVIVAAVASALLAAAPAVGQASVEGSVSYDGQSTPITHVSARHVERLPEMSGPNVSPRAIKILLADRNAPAEVAASESAFMEAATGGRIQGLVLLIDQPSNQWMILSISRPGGDGTMASGGIGPPGFELSDFQVRDNVVSGRVRTLEPQEFFPPGNPSTYAFDIRFRAPVAPVVQPVQSLTGDAARRSPQADAVIGYFTMLRSGDLRRIRAEVDARSPLARQLPRDDGEARAMLAQARDYFPAEPAARASIQRVLVYAHHALVVMRSAQGGSLVTVEPAGAGWRVGAQRMPGD